MRIPRIRLAGPLSEGNAYRIEDDQARYLRKVLRLDDGHPLVVFDGAGSEFEAQLERNETGESEVRLGEATGSNPESAFRVTLIQGICRGQRMDYALQKSVELGVGEVIAVFCERSVVRLDGRRLDKRLRHWRGVVEAACAQSGRTRLPAVQAAENLPQAIKGSDTKGIYLDPGAGTSLSGISPAPNTVRLVVGPEGGLSESERSLLQDAGFTGIRLGPRVLRTETAGTAALTAMQCLWGDLA